MQQVPRYCAIDFTGWIGVANVQSYDDEWYECYWLRLPSYGWHWHYAYGRDAWCQLVLFWHGKDGLTYFWDPVSDNSADNP